MRRTANVKPFYSTQSGEEKVSRVRCFCALQSLQCDRGRHTLLTQLSSRTHVARAPPNWPGRTPRPNRFCSRRNARRQVYAVCARTDPLSALASQPHYRRGEKIGFIVPHIVCMPRYCWSPNRRWEFYNATFPAFPSPRSSGGPRSHLQTT